MSDNETSPESSSFMNADSQPAISSGAVGTHLYFYSDVTEATILSLIKDLRTMSKKIHSSVLQMDMPLDAAQIPIWLHIHSYGGLNRPAFAAADIIGSLRSPVYSVVEGLAASAATILSRSCPKSFITAHSFMLIHQLEVTISGKYAELCDSKHFMDRVAQQNEDFYSARTKMSPEEVHELLGRDIFLNASECIKLGLVDYPAEGNVP